MQQAPARIEEADQEDERRQHADADPVDHGADRPEHEIARRAVPGAQLEIHGAHADRGRGRAAERRAVVEQRPQQRHQRHQVEQRPAETQRQNAEGEDEHPGHDQGDRENDDIDDPGDEAARQHAFEQFRIGRGIIGVRLHIDAEADPPGGRPGARSGKGPNKDLSS